MDLTDWLMNQGLNIRWVNDVKWHLNPSPWFFSTRAALVVIIAFRFQFHIVNAEASRYCMDLIRSIDFGLSAIEGMNHIRLSRLWWFMTVTGPNQLSLFTTIEVGFSRILTLNMLNLLWGCLPFRRIQWLGDGDVYGPAAEADPDPPPGVCGWRLASQWVVEHLPQGPNDQGLRTGGGGEYSQKHKGV